MSLNKETKIRVLENFYALDYVYFGKPVAKVEACCPGLVEDYLSIKGAMLSVMIEMYNLVDLKPSVVTEKVNGNKLKSLAKESAKIARQMCEQLVKTEKGRADIQDDVKASLAENKTDDVSSLIQEKVREKAFKLATDNLLIARAVSEGNEYKKLNDWEGKITEDAYKILRDNLVESALMIADHDDIDNQNEVIKESTEEYSEVLKD